MNQLSVFESHRSISSKWYRYRPQTNTISNRRISDIHSNLNDSNKILAICDRSSLYIF